MYQWRKDIISWTVDKTLYLSVPFTWDLRRAERMAEAHNGPVVAGGPAIKLLGAAWATETRDAVPYDTLAMHNPCATFTTRGCPRKCQFCAVPQIEGDLIELKQWKPAPIICDNNLLAASRKHFEQVIDKLRIFPFVDFNQGFDAQLFTGYHADQITRLRRPKIRFALDHIKQEATLIRAVETARKAGLRNFGIYVLIGFHDTPEDALYRLDLVRSWKIRPTPMRFQPLNAKTKNAYVAPSWTETELRRVVRYYSRLRYLEHIPFKDYRYGEQSAERRLSQEELAI